MSLPLISIIAITTLAQISLSMRYQSRIVSGELGTGIEVIEYPVTYYLKQIETAYVEQEKVDYYSVQVCQTGCRGYKQAAIFISLPGNPDWKLSGYGYVFIQVSRCADSFAKNCVIATNYEWGVFVKAVPNIVFKTKSTDTAYYIRVLAGNTPTRYQIELTFTNDEEPTYFDWETNLPFDGSKMKKKAKPLVQYWKGRDTFTVKNNEKKIFAIGYCDNDNVDGINVGLTAPSGKPYSEFTQWACQTDTQYGPAGCTQAVAIEYYWLNPSVASFNILKCKDSKKRSTEDGIYVVVLGDGAELDGVNYFQLSAVLINSDDDKVSNTTKRIQ